MQYNFSQFKTDLKKVEDRLSKEYGQISTGRASPMILDSVMVESYGSHQPLKNVASISIEDAKTLRVAPWDKGAIKGIEKGILASNLGLSVATDDQGVRVIFPQLTTETRSSLVKVLKERLEESRINVRQERDKVMKDVEAKQKEGKLTEDEKFKAKEELQKIIDGANNALEGLFEKKQKEIMS
jgi:ribosome recycling factor